MIPQMPASITKQIPVLLLGLSQAFEKGRHELQRRHVMNRMAAVVLVLGIFAVPVNLQAQQSLELGEYVIHYNALKTNLLPAQMAQAYGIQRSDNHAMLNVTVLKRAEDGPDKPMEANVIAGAVNLSGQRRTIEMQKISDASGAVYYIGVLRVYNLEQLNFSVNVEIEGLAEPAVIEFSQKFYTE
jgi:hypothetical protein